MERQFTQPANGIQELEPEQQYPGGRERGLLVFGGAERKSELKGSIATWECQRVGRKGGQRWKKKSRNPWRLRITREVERKQLEGEQMAERRDRSQGRSREEDRHSRRAEMQAEKGRCRKKQGNINQMK